MITFKCFVCGKTHQMPKMEAGPSSVPQGWVPHSLWMQEVDGGILRTVTIVTCESRTCAAKLITLEPKASDLWMTPTATA